MDDKPVTKDLIARGFGRDVMGLLLAWREREIVGRYQSLKFYDRKITIAQAQKIINIAKQSTDFNVCNRCDAVSEIKNGELWNMCFWCGKDFCIECQDLREVHVCSDCEAEWCPECGLECPRMNKCICCKQPCCATTIPCTRCELLDAEESQVYPFTTEQYPADEDWNNKKHLAQVCARLGIKPASVDATV